MWFGGSQSLRLTEAYPSLTSLVAMAPFEKIAITLTHDTINNGLCIVHAILNAVSKIYSFFISNFFVSRVLYQLPSPFGAESSTQVAKCRVALPRAA